MTGFSVWIDGREVSGELPHAKFVQYAAELLEKESIDQVVCERYIVSGQTGKYSPANWSLEQIGVLKYLCEKHGAAFTLQNAADAKRFATEDKLNMMHWKKIRGKGHARDAQRHLLLFLVKNDLIDDRVLVQKY